MSKINEKTGVRETAYEEPRERLLCWLKESNAHGLVYTPHWFPESEGPEIGEWIRASWFDEPETGNKNEDQETVTERGTSRKDKRYSARGLVLSHIPPAPPLTCLDCGRFRDDYMVYPRVWKQAANPRGHLCYECLEHRLGRSLNLADFDPNIELNRSIFLGAALGTKNE
jgi:hypothetical protein